VNLSRHDERTPNLDFVKLKKAGVSAAIIRSSIGDGKGTYGKKFPDVDASFPEYVAESRKAGLLIGAYHLVRAGQNGKLQADHFLNTIQTGLPRDTKGVPILLVADGGWSDKVKKATSAQELSDFIERIHEKTGKYPGIYPEKNESFEKNLKAASKSQRDLFRKCWLWFPDYSHKPAQTKGWDALLPGPMILHQYAGVEKNNPLSPKGFNDELKLPYTLLEKSIFLGDSLEQFWTVNSVVFNGQP
jgi:GH25 family lysozyme M1 (1,4-beta-N-acetylmuramidase)